MYCAIACAYASLLAVTVMVWALRAMTRGSMCRVIWSPLWWLALTASAPSSRTANCTAGSEGVHDPLDGPRDGLPVPAAGHPGQRLSDAGGFGAQGLDLIRDGLFPPQRVAVAAEEGELFVVGHRACTSM